MTVISVEPATSERFDDLEKTLTGGGDGASCQCQWWMVPSSEWRGANREAMTEKLEAETHHDISPGLIAYVDGQAAGWVRVGPRHLQRRLMNSRFVRQTPPPLNDETVWAISCFSIRREYRGLGLTAKLLEAAVEHATTHGATRIEGYPIDTDAVRATSNDLYVGTTTLFERAGFELVAHPTPRRAVMALTPA